MRIVIGLGNPGAPYEHTYHNAGALALEAIMATRRDGIVARPETYKKLFTYLQSPNLTLVRPLTFMNESGSAVREAARKFRVAPKDIILLHDDSDLPLGTWKISRGRGAAGHHGVLSAIAALGSNEFTRVRIGIRPKNERVREKAEAFVLRKITKADAAILEKTFDEVAKAIEKDPLVK